MFSERSQTQMSAYCVVPLVLRTKIVETIFILTSRIVVSYHGRKGKGRQ